MSSGPPQVVDSFVGRESYDDLVYRIENRSSPINVSEQLVQVLDYFGHWRQDHISPSVFQRSPREQLVSPPSQSAEK